MVHIPWSRNHKCNTHTHNSSKICVSCELWDVCQCSRWMQSTLYSPFMYYVYILYDRYRYISSNNIAVGCFSCCSFVGFSYFSSILQNRLFSVHKIYRSTWICICIFFCVCSCIHKHWTMNTIICVNCECCDDFSWNELILILPWECGKGLI